MGEVPLEDRLPENRMRHWLRGIGLAGGFAACVLGLAGWRSETAKRDGSAATGDSTPRYLLPFGNNPYLPSEARSSFTQFLKPADVPTAAYCGQCHRQLYKEWRESAHANSFRTPWYTKNVNLLIEQKGIARSRHCEGCHNPIALFSGVLTPASTAPRPFDEEGVTCMTCHAMERVQPMRGLGSYVMGTPTALLDQRGNAIPGMPAPAEILAHLDRHRAAVQHTVLSQPEFCGSCHKANLPRTLNDYKWLRAFDTYGEWQQSGWSGETPISFFHKPTKTCQDCHMPAMQSAPNGSYGTQYRSHRWAAANTLVAAQYGYPEQAREVTAFLQNGALRVDIFALSQDGPQVAGQHPSIGPVIAPIDRSTFTLHPNQSLTVSVVVQNTGIGHSLVPEQRDFYESWVQFEVRDEAGRLVYASGEVGPDHRLQPDTHTFGNQIIDRTGARLTHHEVWNVNARAYDSTVLPGRADVERYRFRVPAGASGLTVTAAVKYRRFRREFTDWVFGDKPGDPDRSPTVTVAQSRVALNVGENTPQTSPSAAPKDVLRYTAFGIALLDRAEFPAAREAFGHVLALAPEDADSYIDMGVVSYSAGNFEEALGWLARAKKLAPESIRARYYEGLSDRWLYRYPEAIAAFKAVAAKFPRFRQVHDDLGWALLIQKQDALARDQFEEALAIDPDDAVAHKWLSTVYTRLGDPIRAAEEAAQEAQMKDDPVALWGVLAYWRANLGVAYEVTPGHVHGAEADTTDVERILNTQNPPSMVWIQR